MQGRYILLTAARNEAAHIGRTIESVLAQSKRPEAWFVVDDGSSDQTAEVVASFAASHPFIRLQASGSQAARSFGSKDKAINAAYQAAGRLEFDFIGILDADITVERTDYYETMTRLLWSNARLGIVGGYIHEQAAGRWRCRDGNSKDSVAGAIQLFRRACFEQIGGYTPLHYGGEDWLAQIEARRNGWEVIARPDFHVLHYRPTSSASGRWRGLFRSGMMDASFGSHPVFELLKCARRLKARPLVLGGIARLAGYCWWRVAGRPPLIGPEQVKFLRQEQVAKMRRRAPAFPPMRVGRNLSA